MRIEQTYSYAALYSTGGICNNIGGMLSAFSFFKVVGLMVDTTGLLSPPPTSLPLTRCQNSPLCPLLHNNITRITPECIEKPVEGIPLPDAPGYADNVGDGGGPFGGPPGQTNASLDSKLAQLELLRPRHRPGSL